MTQDQDVPIDIITNKLVDWLISRRHVKKNWPDAVQNVREKLNNAIQDMPEHSEITKLLSGSYINYFHCIRIVEILKETEMDTKNIFGWYSSQRMKDWQEVLKLYERDNIYLVEASQYLVRNVAYEIPSLKRIIAKAKHSQQDCDKRIQEYTKNASNAKEKFYSTCKQMGLKGENVRCELLDLLRELPKEFEGIALKIKPLKEAIDFYREFANFINPSLKNSPAPLVSLVIDHGDITVYEWKYGEAPIEIKKSSLDYSPKNDKEENGFVVVDNEPEDDVINFGDEVLSTGDIDWGTLDTPSGDENPQIDWDIPEDGNNFSDIVVESSGHEGGVAEGDEALTVLYNEATRTTFINELLELQGFLMQRKVEMVATESVLSMSQFSTAPKILQYQNLENIQIYSDIIDRILADLSSPKMQHLYLISISPRYVDRFSDSLCAKYREREKLLSAIETMERKRTEAIMEEQKMAAQLKLLSERSKELQRKIEKDISKRYNQRKVNLMGTY